MTSSMDRLAVRTTIAGQPLAVERNGREWLVAAEPLRWFERTKWWETAGRMPKGQGRVDVEVWRVQVRLGRNPRSDLSTLELERDPDGGTWSLRDVGAGSTA